MRVCPFQILNHLTVFMTLDRWKVVALHSIKGYGGIEV